MRYQIVQASSLHKLEEIVNNELKHDWTVIGGVIAINEPSAPVPLYFAQAMTKFGPQTAEDRHPHFPQSDPNDP